MSQKKKPDALIEHNKTNSAYFRHRKKDKKLFILGRGTSGVVVLYETKEHFRYVGKKYLDKEKYESSKEFHKRVLHEYSILKKLENVHTIEVYNYKISFTGKIQMFMEAASVDLSQLLRKRSYEGTARKEAECLWKQLCNGVLYLHEEANVCHRDIKLQNLVIDLKTGLLKIIDFMTAVSFLEGSEQEKLDQEKYCYGLVGTKSYAAPETFSQIKYMGTGADIWSIGIVLFFMIEKKSPWEEANKNNMEFSSYSAMQEQDRISWLSNYKMFDPQSMSLINAILNPQCSSRPKISDFYKDTWFREIQCCDAASCGFDHKMLYVTWTESDITSQS